jgi:hypothetical protein
MPEIPTKPSPPRFVVLRETTGGAWKILGEVRRKPGLAAQAARTHAIFEVTGGKAKAGEVYAAVLASEWGVAQKWNAPNK